MVQVYQSKQNHLVGLGLTSTTDCLELGLLCWRQSEQDNKINFPVMLFACSAFKVSSKLHTDPTTNAYSNRLQEAAAVLLCGLKLFKHAALLAPPQSVISSQAFSISCQRGPMCRFNQRTLNFKLAPKTSTGQTPEAQHRTMTGEVKPVQLSKTPGTLIPHPN